MPRSVPEWIGRTPDTPVPQRVRVRVFEDKEGRCHKCRRQIRPGDRWTCEHLKALINGGENRESNLDLTCDWCLPEKNAADVREKAVTYRKRSKHIGAAAKSRRPIPGSKESGWKQKLTGEWVRR